MSENAYFKKEILRNFIRIGSTIVQFESVGGETGVKVVETSDPVFAVLEGYADKRRMGVTRISAEIFESLKKNPIPERTSQPPSVGQPIRAFNRESVLPKAKSLVVAQPVESVASEPVILQQATQNPDGTPGTPVNVAAPAATLSARNPPRAFTRKAKASEVAAKAEPAINAPKV